MLGLAITSDSIDFRLRFLVQSLIFPFLFSATFHSPFAETKAGTREDGLEAKKNLSPLVGCVQQFQIIPSKAMKKTRNGLKFRDAPLRRKNYLALKLGKKIG